MKTTATLFLLSAAASATLLTAAAKAQSRVEVPILFDDFLADNGGIPKDNFRLFFEWNVSFGSVDLVGPPITDVTGDPIFERFVDLGGSTRHPGRFSFRAPLPFVAGATYRLSFRYKSTDGKPAAARVLLGSKNFDVSTSSTEFQEFSEEFSFPRQTLARLMFQGVGRDTDNSGLGIDTVMVSQVFSFPNTNVSVFGGVGKPSLGVGVSVLP